MAALAVQRVTSRLMQEIRDSVRNQERRYLKSETNRPEKATVSWKLERNPNSANSWEYRVVSRGWVISPKEKSRRLILGRIGCFARILERVFGDKDVEEKGWSRPRWKRNIEKAIQGLIELQKFECGDTTIHEDTPLEARLRLEPTIGTAGTDGRYTIRKETQEKRRQQLYRLWKEFVISTRIKAGRYDRLPALGEGRCRCGRARISYPHWPPTSIEEADAQFEYCIDEQNEHRRPLVINWWRHFNEFASMEEWTASEPQQRYRDAEAAIREMSPVVQRELERTTKVQKRPKGWSCREYCEKVLMENRCECLCFCVEHHDECPTHSRQ